MKLLWYAGFLICVCIPPISWVLACLGKECAQISSVVCIVWVSWCALSMFVWIFSYFYSKKEMEDEGLEVNIIGDITMDIKLWYFIINITAASMAALGSVSGMISHDQFENPNISQSFIVFVISVVFCMFYITIVCCLVFIFTVIGLMIKAMIRK